MNSEAIIAIISVISAALVSILSISVPIFIEREKRKQEEASTQIERIHNSTLELLDKLSSLLLSDAPEDTGEESRPSPQGNYRDLVTKHYAWELAIWPWLSEDEQRQVREIRKQVQITTFSRDSSGNFKNTERVLALTDAAVSRIPRNDLIFLSSPSQLWLILAIVILIGGVTWLILALR